MLNQIWGFLSCYYSIVHNFYKTSFLGCYFVAQEQTNFFSPYKVYDLFFKIVLFFTFFLIFVTFLYFFKKTQNMKKTSAEQISITLI